MKSKRASDQSHITHAAASLAQRNSWCNMAKAFSLKQKLLIYPHEQQL
jgi:hypothetical protein